MVSIRVFRENPKLIRESQKKRYQPVELVDKVINLDNKWRETLQEVEKLKHKRNIVSKEINELKKQGKSIKEKIKEMGDVVDEIKRKDEDAINLLKQREELRQKVGAILYEKVPIGKNEDKNKVIKKWGIIPKFKFKPKSHIELIEDLKIGDFTQSAKVSGSRFYYLTGKLALLNQALIRFTVDFMSKGGYTYIETPLMLRKKVITAAWENKDIEEHIYKIEGEDLNLIGTAEHSILAFHTNQILKEEDLPLKYFSYSMSFRKELGSHGIVEKGLFRTHQFNKIEQFIFCKPEDSYKYYDELLKNIEQIYQKLKIPYRLLDFCSGAVGLMKSKTLDLEAWMPSQNKYREVGSLSNCVDSQAERAHIKFINKKGETQHVYTLNNTAVATSRTLIAILENYQQKDGSIKVPVVLQKYLNFKKIEKEQKCPEKKKRKKR